MPISRLSILTHGARVAWAGLLIAILFDSCAALPQSPSRLLYLLNLNIPFTPVTSDMAYFRDDPELGSRYKTSFDLNLIPVDSPPLRLDLQSQDFHLVKMPLLLLLEAIDESAPHELHIRALCSEFQRKRGPIHAFSANATLFACR